MSVRRTSVEVLGGPEALVSRLKSCMAPSQTRADRMSATTGFLVRLLDRRHASRWAVPVRVGTDRFVVPPFGGVPPVPAEPPGLGARSADELPARTVAALVEHR